MMVPIKDDSSGAIFEISDGIPEEIAKEAFNTVKARGLLPDSEDFVEQFLDEVERLLSE
jgi:hypothetical protein